MTNLINFISVLIKDQDQCCRYEYLNSNSSFFISSQFYGIFGVFEKKGMYLTGRKKHRNPESPQRQASFLKWRFLKQSSLSMLFLIITAVPVIWITDIISWSA